MSQSDKKITTEPDNKETSQTATLRITPNGYSKKVRAKYKDTYGQELDNAKNRTFIIGELEDNVEDSVGQKNEATSNQYSFPPITKRVEIDNDAQREFTNGIDKILERDVKSKKRKKKSSIKDSASSIEEKQVDSKASSSISTPANTTNSSVSPVAFEEGNKVIKLEEPATSNQDSEMSEMHKAELESRRNEINMAKQNIADYAKQLDITTQDKEALNQQLSQLKQLKEQLVAAQKAFDELQPSTAMVQPVLLEAPQVVAKNPDNDSYKKEQRIKKVQEGFGAELLNNLQLLESLENQQNQINTETEDLRTGKGEARSLVAAANLGKRIREQSNQSQANAAPWLQLRSVSPTRFKDAKQAMERRLTSTEEVVERDPAQAELKVAEANLKVERERFETAEKLAAKAQTQMANNKTDLNKEEYFKALDVKVAAKDALKKAQENLRLAQEKVAKAKAQFDGKKKSLENIVNAVIEENEAEEALNLEKAKQPAPKKKVVKKSALKKRIDITKELGF